jgi:hypothetical protein
MAINDLLGDLLQNKLADMSQRQQILNPLQQLNQPTLAQRTLSNLIPSGPQTPQSQNILQGLGQALPQIKIPETTQQPEEAIKPAIKPRVGRKSKETIEEIKLPAAERKKQAIEERAKKREETKTEQIERAELKKIQPQLRKEKQAYISKLEGAKNSLYETNLTLNRMEKLIDEGGLPVAAFYKLFKNLEEKVNPAVAAGIGGGIGTYLGGPVGAIIGTGIGGLISPVATMLRYAQRLTSPNTEEFEKLSASFIRNVKDIFGNRPTNLDVDKYLLTIPSLEQTDAGKRAIIHNMKVFNDAIEAKYKAYQEVLKENGGLIPKNLEVQVEEKAKPELDELSQEFVNVNV